ncbi:MAG: YeeE/YedE thiosulfate transporter family protein [Vicinamibacterales bacterium]
MPLLLFPAPPWHWALAGSLIAVITLLLLFVANKRLGVSSGLEDICSLVIHNSYFRRRAVTSGRGWRLPFVVGLFLGGVLSAVLGGGWAPTWTLGRLDTALALGHAGTLAWMFVGGLFVGVGTRLANGCTSGHGIFGLSNLEWPSLVAVVTFMLAGIVTTQVLYHIVLH